MFSVSFKGYKNVFCAYDVPLKNNKYATFMSMQLNDADGKKDLAEYNKIKELQGEPLDGKYADVLTFTYIKDYNTRKDHLYFNEHEMYWGDELRVIGEDYVPKLMSQEKYKLEEKLHMKVYTLMAGLTKRMSLLLHDYDDKEKVKVIESMYHTLSNVINSNREAYKLVENACITLKNSIFIRQN